jgi:hypothetical protein
VREASAVDAEVPIISVYARRRDSVQQAVLALLHLLLDRAKAKGAASWNASVTRR